MAVGGSWHRTIARAKNSGRKPGRRYGPLRPSIDSHAAAVGRAAPVAKTEPQRVSARSQSGRPTGGEEPGGRSVISQTASRLDATRVMHDTSGSQLVRRPRNGVAATSRG